jgi:AAA+ superfamily predicted ATPase
MNICDNDTFTNLEAYAANISNADPVLSTNILQAKTLYENAKFYYQAAELQGSLVSYSCAAILLDSIRRSIEHNIQLDGGPSPGSGNQSPGAASSISLNSLGATTVASNSQQSSLQSQPSSPVAASSPPLLSSAASSNGSNGDIHQECVNILSCCLNAVEELQQKVRSSGGSSGGNKDDEEVKDWDKICVKNQPLTFNKGSNECLFFSDVIGLEREKKMVEASLIYPLVYPNLYPKASKGILIYGPPGTGKTYMVKAAVNQLQIKEPGVGVLFFAPSPGDLKGKYVGETEKRIEEAFTCASRAACKYETESCVATKKKFISILFMDEMDAIGPNRDRDTTGLAANSVNTLLQMMDGIKSFPNVAVVAATNYPWNLDDAILRRFDTQILIDIPTENDIFSLLKFEMKSYITLKADKTGYSYCEEQKKKSSSGKKGNEQTKTICQIECEKKIVKDLYLEEPYNKLYIDFFEDIKKKNGIMAQIAADIASKGFSNSDVNRLMKAAATNAGELAVKSNLFYSTNLINDFVSEKYISSLTKIRDERLGILQSLKIMMSFYDTQPLGNNFYQAEKPNYAYIIDEDGWVAFNTKCILYKSEYMIDDPLIENTYIPFYPKDAHNRIVEYIMGKTDDSDEKDRLIRWYKYQILGYKSAKGGESFSNVVLNQELQSGPNKFADGTKLTGADVVTDENMFIKKKNNKYEINKILMVLEFKLTFIKSNQAKDTESLAIIPKSEILINNVMAPIYNSYRSAEQNYFQLNKTKDGVGTSWLQTTFAGFSPEDVQKVERKTDIFNFRASPNSVRVTTVKNAAVDAIKRFIQTNTSYDTDAKKCDAVIEAVTTAVNGANQDIKDIFIEAMNKYKSINKDCTPMDILAVIQSIREPLNEAINTDDNPFINTAAQKIIAKEFSTADSTAITNLNKKFDDIKFNELDFYNYLVLCKSILKIKVEQAGQGAQDALTAFSNNTKLFSTYINCFSNTDSTKNITEISIREINLNDQEFITKLTEKKLSTVTLNKKIKKLGSDKESMTENLLYNTETKMYYITPKEFKSLIKYWNVYDKIENMDIIRDITPTGIPPAPLASAAPAQDPYENYYIQIHKDFFQIMFKDVFEIDTKYFSPYDMKKVKFCETTTQKLVQLYIDDVIKFYNFGKIFTIVGTQPYILKMYLDKLNVDIDENNPNMNIITSICLRVYDNYVLSNTEMLYVLGKKYPQDNIKDAAKNLNKDALDDAIGFGGNRNKSKTFKNIKNKKNTSLRNTKQKGGVDTVPSEKIDINVGDEVKKQYNKFLRFCINNTETPDDNSSQNIANKSIFISTEFDVAGVKVLKKTSAWHTAFGGLKKGFKFISDKLANLINPDYDEAQANKNNALKQEILQELKTSKLLLPSIFKKINSIGFLIQKSEKKYSDANFQGNNAQKALNFFGKSTIDDDKIKGQIEINWIYFDKYRGVFAGLYDGISAIFIDSPDGVANKIANLVSLLYAAGSAAAYAGGYLEAATLTAVGGLGVVTGVAGTIFVGSIIQAIYSCWSPDLSKDQVIGNALNIAIFDLVTSIRVIDVETLAVNPSILFLNYIDDKALSATESLRLEDKKLAVEKESETKTVADKTSDNFSFNASKIFTKQPRFHANVLQMATRYGNLFIDNETTEERVRASVPKKKIEKSWIFRSNIVEEDDEVAIKAAIDAIKLDPLILPILHDIKKYTDNSPEIPGIKSKLKNLNIPFSSFYYALSVVKSTYNPETGKMLKAYYADKTKFMKEFGKKLEK